MSQAMQPPMSSTTAAQGGFWSGVGDVFTTGVQKYLDIRAAEKMAEIDGTAQLANNQAIEQQTNVGAQPQATAQQADDNQLLNGVDNKLLMLGGVGLVALLLVLKR